MNWVDNSLFVLLGVGAIFGAVSGIVWQIARLITYGASVYASIYFHEPIAAFLQPYVGGSPVSLKVITYVVTFMGIYLLLHVITLAIERMIKAVRLKPVDRLLGAGLGLVKAGLIAGAVLMGLALYPNPATETALAQSRIAPALLNVMHAVIVAVPQE